MNFNEIIERCPELFIEIIRLINDVKGIDLLSFMLVNKQWFNLIDNYSNQILYKLLCQDRLQKEYFNSLTNNNNIDNNNNYKELFINNFLSFWSKHLQTYPPFGTKSEESFIRKCQQNKCWLNKQIINTNKENDLNTGFVHIRSKKPITKDITIYFYVEHLQKQIDHSNKSFLLIGIMNEVVFNGIVQNKEKSTYVGGISLNVNNKLQFNSCYASNGYIAALKDGQTLTARTKNVWKEGDVICVKVTGVKERKICISYYLNDEIMDEIKGTLDGVDVINIEENRLYFDANILQNEDNLDNTVLVASFTKPTVTNK